MEILNRLAQKLLEHHLNLDNVVSIIIKYFSGSSIKTYELI